MAPLIPSESKAYTITLPQETEDDRQNLKIRSGAALVCTNSSIVTFGGLTIGLDLESVTIPHIESKLAELAPTGPPIQLISNELFYLNIINREWNKIQSYNDTNRPKPRFYHSISFHSHMLYVFGGLTFDEETDEIITLNDLWQYSIDRKEWICIDDGSTSGAVARYDHTTHIVGYVSPVDNSTRKALAITGGRGELNQPLANIAIFDLETQTYLGNTEMGLILSETVVKDSESSTFVNSEFDPKSQADVKKLKIVSEDSFVVSAASKPDATEPFDDTFYIFSSGTSDSHKLSPIIFLSIAPHAVGLRTPLSTNVKKNPSVVPNNLKYPTGGVFGSNIIISGRNTVANEYQLYLFNRPTGKWTRLNIASSNMSTNYYLWKSFSWHSHHKILVLGSASFPDNAKSSTIQKFDLMVLVGLPITNIFHAFTSISELENDIKGSNFSSLKENKSFEAYSKYAAPKTKISSIKSVFPNHAVALGRNAFERYGSSLSDFEFVTADGDKVNVPLMLLRKRWGRCFDMLLSKAYARAVYRLKADKFEDHEEKKGNPSNLESKNPLKSVNNPLNSSDRGIPEFRLPFQERKNKSQSDNSLPLGNSLPTSRKASVVSTDNTSITSSQTTDDLNLGDIPPQLPFPNEPLPILERFPSLKAVQSRDYLKDSPRGSISGASFAGNSISDDNNLTSVRLQDLRSTISSSKKKLASRQASFQAVVADDSSILDVKSTTDSFSQDISDDATLVLEPLLIPRSLYLPFNTDTVSAIAEFMYTGQLGDKWLLTPTTTDSFMIAKFYEIPLLYDLISEVLYAIIGKKEESLINEYTDLISTYQTRLGKHFNGDKVKIDLYHLERPNFKKTCEEIENLFNTVDDGFLNLSILRKTSKVSEFSFSSSSDSIVDTSKKPSSHRSGRFGKSSLSKEVEVEDDSNEKTHDDDDEDDDDDDDDDIENEKEDEQYNSETVNEKSHHVGNDLDFKNNSSVKLNQDDSTENLDPLLEKKKKNLKLKTGNIKQPIETRRSLLRELDDEDPLSASGPSLKTKSIDDDTSGQISKSNKEETDSTEDSYEVPEGRFSVPRRHLKVEDSSEESRSNNVDDSSSDSEDLAVGLGLISNVKLNGKKKIQGSNSKNGDSNHYEELDEFEVDNNLPTLANLASPTSLPAGDHLIQIIYETSALACDSKLLLLSTNVLEVSRFLNKKRTELLKQLDEFILSDLEERFKKERILKDPVPKIFTEISRSKCSTSPNSRPGNEAIYHDSNPMISINKNPSVQSSLQNISHINEGVDSVIPRENSIGSSFRSKIPVVRSFSSTNKPNINNNEKIDPRASSASLSSKSFEGQSSNEPIKRGFLSFMRKPKNKSKK